MERGALQPRGTALCLALQGAGWCWDPTEGGAGALGFVRSVHRTSKVYGSPSQSTRRWGRSPDRPEASAARQTSHNGGRSSLCAVEYSSHQPRAATEYWKRGRCHGRAASAVLLTFNCDAKSHRWPATGVGDSPGGGPQAKLARWRAQPEAGRSNLSGKRVLGQGQCQRHGWSGVFLGAGLP